MVSVLVLSGRRRRGERRRRPGGAGGGARDGERQEPRVVGAAQGDVRVPPGGGPDAARHGGPARGRVPAARRRQRGRPLRRLRRPLRRRRRHLPPRAPLRQHPRRGNVVSFRPFAHCDAARERVRDLLDMPVWLAAPSSRTSGRTRWRRSGARTTGQTGRCSSRPAAAAAARGRRAGGGVAAGRRR